MNHSTENPELDLPEVGPAGGVRPVFGRREWVVAGALLGLLIAAYIPALVAGFIWDDDFYVTQNLPLRNLAGLWRIWTDSSATPQYYPLVHTTFWLEYHLWGLHPLGFHAVNLGLHALSAVLLYRVLTRLRVPGAWLAAAIFALHPVQVESVAWITERKNVLSTLFYLAAARAYLGFTPLESPDDPGPRQWGRYCLSLGLFVAALLSKTVTCSLPAALLLARWWKSGRLRWADFWPLIPFFALGAGSGFGTAWLEKHQVGALGADWSLNVLERGLIAGRALWFYVAKLLWPIGLCFNYTRWHINARLWWQWLFPAAALGVVAALWLGRRRIGRGPLTAVLFFAGTVGPALGFVNIFPMRYSFVADHYQYLASVGVIALASVWLSRLPRVVLGFLLVALAGLTCHQGRIYRDVETLWRDTLAKNPKSSLAHNYFGNELLGRGEFEAALDLFREDLRLNPNDEVAQFNSGCALVGEGRLDEAVACFREAVRIRPRYGRAHYYLGATLAKRGRIDDAVESYHNALRSYPTNSAVLNSLGGALMTKGEYPEAVACFEAAIRSHPEIAALHSNLGQALAASNRLEDAIGAYQKSLKLNPSSAVAHSGLGLLLLKKGLDDEARKHLQEAVRLSASDTTPRESLGAALQELGRRQP